MLNIKHASAGRQTFGPGSGLPGDSLLPNLPPTPIHTRPLPCHNSQIRLGVHLPRLHGLQHKSTTSAVQHPSDGRATSTTPHRHLQALTEGAPKVVYRLLVLHAFTEDSIQTFSKSSRVQDSGLGSLVYCSSTHGCFPALPDWKLRGSEVQHLDRWPWAGPVGCRGDERKRLQFILIL